MVVREIREDGKLDARAVEPPLGQSDGRGLDGASPQPLIDETPKLPLQQDRIRGRHAGGHKIRRPAHAQCSHQAAGDRVTRVQARQRLCQPPRGGRLAVGAGDSQNVKLRRGLPEKERRDRPGGGFEGFEGSH